MGMLGNMMEVGKLISNFVLSLQPWNTCWGRLGFLMLLVVGWPLLVPMWVCSALGRRLWRWLVPVRSPPIIPHYYTRGRDDMESRETSNQPRVRNGEPSHEELPPSYPEAMESEGPFDRYPETNVFSASVGGRPDRANRRRDREMAASEREGDAPVGHGYSAPGAVGGWGGKYSGTRDLGACPKGSRTGPPSKLSVKYSCRMASEIVGIL
jgi:hypothetical protein